MADLMENEEVIEEVASDSSVLPKRDSNYTVLRNNVYTGILVQGYKIKREVEDRFERRTGEYYLESYNPYRSMIFSLTENRMALDLLYDTPLVSVLNYSGFSMTLPDKFIVDYAVNIGPLLERLGFDEELHYEDILRFKEMINEEVLRQNISLFDENTNNKNLGLKKLLVKLSFNKKLKKKAVSTINNSMTTYEFLKLKRTLDSKLARMYNESNLNPFDLSKREKVKSLKQE